MTEMREVKLNSQWTLTLPEHRAALPEWETGWERERLDAMHAVIRSGDTIVDVGAEEGDMSALCALWAGPDGGMILMEPNPKVWPNIRAIWRHNDDLALVRRWFVGFAARTTERHPPKDDVNEHWNGGIYDGKYRPRFWPHCAYGDLITDHGFRHLYQQTDATPRIRLDDLIRDTPVDVITMDVEGSELEVLWGARGVLIEQRPVVFVSIHAEFMIESYKVHPLVLHHYMEDLGYKHRWIATDHEEHRVFWHPDGRRA